jgi:nicotinate-nucleotide adenylyltransferase
MKIGICGGTFDPFHRGHLDPVLAVRDAMQWDRVIYIPAHRQPFKEEREFASPFHRFSMAVLATEGIGAMWVSPMELEREGTSYTVDTLEALRGEYPDATLDWIIGDDNLAQLGEWRKIARIAELANFAVLTRVGAAGRPETYPGGFRTAADPAERPRNGVVVFAENKTVPVSSTEVRQRVRDGAPVDALVDPRVSRYIDHYGLYKRAT